jgi:hypothetical protein
VILTHIANKGQCYNQDFGDFRQFSAKKMAIVLKAYAIIIFFCTNGCHFEAKSTFFSAEIFRKFTTSTAGQWSEFFRKTRGSEKKVGTNKSPASQRKRPATRQFFWRIFGEPPSAPRNAARNF